MQMNRIALFPGSFDPFTAGHLNILTRALTIFDEVIVAVGINQDKRGFFTMEQREDIIRQATKGIDGVRIIHYEGLTIDICRELGIRHIVRGVRNMTDFDNEQAIADAIWLPKWTPSSYLPPKAIRTSPHPPSVTLYATTAICRSSSLRESLCRR